MLHSIQYFLSQDYPNKELIILDDGDDRVEDLIPVDSRIQYISLKSRLTLGKKLNIGCAEAKGDIIAHWDDDDWYSSNRITYQVESLIQNDFQLCGINDLMYYDLVNHVSYNYRYPSNLKIWLSGSSLCYTKDLWNRNKFANINVGMDGLFVWNTDPGLIYNLPDNTFTILFIHGANVSPKKTNNHWWFAGNTDKIKEILNNDWARYQALVI